MNGFVTGHQSSWVVVLAALAGMLAGLHCSSTRIVYRYRDRPRPTRTPDKPVSDETRQTPSPSVDKLGIAPQKKPKVFVFMLEPKNLGGPRQREGVDIPALVTSLLKGSVNALPEVRLRSYRELPDLARRIAAAGDFGTKDRVSLVAMRHRFGLDGLIEVSYRSVGDELKLRIRYVDLASGQARRAFERTTTYSAALFAWLERQTLDFAASLRRVYRATMHVSTTPKGARVLVDGKLVGVSPVVLELPQGTHRLRLEKPGYRAVSREVVLRDGQELRLDSTLYTPLAHYYTRRETRIRLDSTHFNLGYRFAYLIRDPLHLEGLHLATFEYLLQFRRFAFGAKIMGNALRGTQSFDTIFGPGSGSATQRGNVLQLVFHLRYTIVDIFSFLSIYAAAEIGTTRYKVNGIRNWTLASGLFAGAAARLVRNGNFSLEFNLEAGFAYNGEIEYAERVQNLFGSAFTRRRLAPALGPTVGATLVFRFWNDVF